MAMSLITLVSTFLNFVVLELEMMTLVSSANNTEVACLRMVKARSLI